MKNPDLHYLYQGVKGSREVMFGHLEAIGFEVVCQEFPAFSHRSIRGQLLHVVGCYNAWTTRLALGESCSWQNPTDFNSVADFREVYKTIDSKVLSATESGDLDKEFIALDSRGLALKVSKRWLITHPITHEYHHKGQIMALARLLGHPLEGSDTDFPSP